MNNRPKYLVTLSNFAGELERRYAHSEKEAGDLAIEMIEECGKLLSDGDKITVQELA